MFQFLKSTLKISTVGANSMDRKKIIIGMLLAFTTLAGGSAAVSATRTAWTFGEKNAAQDACSRQFGSGNNYFSCVLGVTVYGDGRQWQELNWEKDRALQNCLFVGPGSVNFSAYKQGCNFAYNYD